MKDILRKTLQKLLLFSAALWISLSSTLLLSQASLVDAQAAPLSAETSRENSSKKNFDARDTSRVFEYTNSTKKELAPVTSSTEASITESEVVEYYAQPILFIAQDMQEDAANVPAITESFQLINRWYSGALELNNSGYAVTLKNTIVYKAPHPFSYYKCPNHETSCDTFEGIWPNVQTELLNAGYPLWSAGTSHVILVKGAGGWAGANCVPNCGTNWPGPGPASNAGVAILGDWALDGISGVVNPECFAQIGTACYQEPQRGAIGHEFGHTFGLAHAMDQSGSIMSTWWLYPNVSLLSTPGNDEKSLLRNDSNFFSPVSCTPDVLVKAVSQPQSVKTATSFTAQFEVMNYGYCGWVANKTDLSIVRDAVWGTKMQVLPTPVYPGQSHTFSLTLTAPTIRAKSLPAVKQSIWQMRTNKNFFGPQMGGPITVIR